MNGNGTKKPKPLDRHQYTKQELLHRDKYVQVANSDASAKEVDLNQAADRAIAAILEEFNDFKQ